MIDCINHRRNSRREWQTLVLPFLLENLKIHCYGAVIESKLTDSMTVDDFIYKLGGCYAIEVLKDFTDSVSDYLNLYDINLPHKVGKYELCDNGWKEIKE